MAVIWMLKDPNSNQKIEHMPPEQLVEDILAKEQQIIKIINEIKKLLEEVVE